MMMMMMIKIGTPPVEIHKTDYYDDDDDDDKNRNAACGDS
jgi:hypothetical protein